VQVYRKALAQPLMEKLKSWEQYNPVLYWARRSFCEAYDLCYPPSGDMRVRFDERYKNGYKKGTFSYASL